MYHVIVKFSFRGYRTNIQLENSMREAPSTPTKSLLCLRDCEVCENGERKSYRFFISHHARRVLRSSCLRALCVYKQYTCIARTGAIWVVIFLPVWTRVKNSRDSNRAFFDLCGHAQK